MKKIFMHTKYNRLSEVDYKVEVFKDVQGNLKFYGWGPYYDESKIDLIIQLMEEFNVQNANSGK